MPYWCSHSVIFNLYQIVKNYGIRKISSFYCYIRLVISLALPLSLLPFTCGTRMVFLQWKVSQCFQIWIINISNTDLFTQTIYLLYKYYSKWICVTFSFQYIRTMSYANDLLCQLPFILFCHQTYFVTCISMLETNWKHIQLFLSFELFLCVSFSDSLKIVSSRIVIFQYFARLCGWRNFLQTAVKIVNSARRIWNFHSMMYGDWYT